ncbi:winged helix-turn-helix domain-containing protein [Halorussus sp. MSC15.2]|uniref:helix-turn-helix transcriptional regulator n=1 Tax=Halorussus sp. MSC15.2 TaxID=2283638 RepID=UPI0013CFF560|nr:hypothetical protein [Halorussus sp. MSC15.2]NEU58021.1 hypothetical protein [Halorussus sp. MSC15.2]
MAPESSEVLLECVQKRGELLAEIRDGTVEKRDLTDSLPVSRSTVNRAISELTELEIVRERAGDCELTLYGESLYQSYRRFIHLYDKLLAAKPLLVNLPSSFPFDYDVLRSATVHVCERPDPRKPLTALHSRVEDGDEVQVLSSVVMPATVELYYEQITEQNLTAEFTLSAFVLEHLLSEYPEKTRTVLELEHTTFHTIEEDLTFELVVVDGTEVWFGVYDERGRIVGAFVADTSTAIEWAESLYADFRDGSSPIASSRGKFDMG